MLILAYLTRASAAILLLAAPVSAHESFLLLHQHFPHTHGDETAHGHEHADHGSKNHIHLQESGPAHEDHFSLATGLRYTRYHTSHGSSGLWETGLGVDVAVRPWLHVGGDLSYGWFDSDEGDAEGLLVPHMHVDFHIPLSSHWELISGLEVGLPGGEERLVGRHWEWSPHVELRHDRGAWYVEAGASLTFITGNDHEHGHSEDDHLDAGELDHHEEDHADEHEGEEHGHEEDTAGETHADHSHGDALTDFHEIVDPHGERELRYRGAIGVRLLDQRLALEARVAGVHVITDDTTERNYLRVGMRSLWRLHDNVTVSAEGSIPVTDAERNAWQASVSVRVGF